MTRVLVVDDEPQILRGLRTNLRARGYEVITAPDGETALATAAKQRPDVVDPRPRAAGHRRRRGDPRAPRLERDAASWCCRRATRSATRCAPSTPAPTTTSRSRSAWTSCWRGSARPCDELHPSDEEPVGGDRRRSRWTWARSASAPPTATCGSRPPSGSSWRSSCATRASCVSQRQLLQEVWGPQYQDETNYLRVYMAQIRRKLEPDPASPGTSSPSRAWATDSNRGEDHEEDGRRLRGRGGGHRGARGGVAPAPR